MNGPVIFLAKFTKMNPRLRGNNLVTKYRLTEGSCVIPNKAAYMDDKIWEKVVKVVAPGIKKMSVIKFFLFLLYFILYLYKSTSIFLQIIYRIFVTSQSGGPY